MVDIVLKIIEIWQDAKIIVTLICKTLFYRQMNYKSSKWATKKLCSAVKWCVKFFTPEWTIII